jgi:hypothetical protein
VLVNFENASGDRIDDLGGEHCSPLHWHVRMPQIENMSRFNIASERSRLASCARDSFDLQILGRGPAAIVDDLVLDVLALTERA